MDLWECNNIEYGGLLIGQSDQIKLQQFITNHRWQWAKTYAEKSPHYYIVVSWLSNNDRNTFYWMVRYIRSHGFRAHYFNWEGTYLSLGSCYYWTMGAPVRETTVINRTKHGWYDLKDGYWWLKKGWKDEEV